MAMCVAVNEPHGKDGNMRVAALTVVSGIVFSTFVFTNATLGQGSLTPQGAPGPMMKTLQQVEPRVPISSLPYRISLPGSYYMTTNLTGSAGGTNGITIATDNVTLDLNGFTLSGVPGSGHGIAVEWASEFYSKVGVYNGIVERWGNHGVNTFYARSGCVQGIGAVSNGLYGIYAGTSFIVVDCSAIRNGATGIAVEAGSVLARCVASWNAVTGIYGGAGSTITHCSAQDNNSRGIQGGPGATITDSTARYNEDYGIIGFEGSTIRNCTASGNTATGLYAANDGGTISDCTSDANNGDGIYGAAGSIVSRCVARRNTGHGITVWSYCSVTGNTCDQNGYSSGVGAGIRVTGGANRIEGNHVTRNDWGIDIAGEGNLIMSSSASGNNTNFNIVGGNHFGTIVTNPGSAFVSSNSAANFSF